jgi:hypothetical protein
MLFSPLVNSFDHPVQTLLPEFPLFEQAFFDDQRKSRNVRFGF